MHRSSRAALVAALGFLAACQDQGSTPISVTDSPEPQAARVEGYRTRGEVREGYIYGRDGKPVRVTFEIHGGRAIWQGDIDLGPASSIPRTAAELRPNGPRLGITIDGVFGGVRWPGGVIPYVIDAALPSQSRVTNAISHIESNTSVLDFIPRTTQEDYVRIRPGTGCSSAVGRLGGQQSVYLDAGCITGNVIHELLHTAGMDHEQSRCDRDSYVQIVWANVDPTRVGNFEMRCDGYSDSFAYAEGSIMHYPADAFSINGQPTILSLRGLAGLMGQRTAMGSTDVSTIDAIYPTPPPPAIVTSVTTNPSPAKQYLPYSITINGSGFDPASVQVQISGGPTSSCPTPCTSTSFTTRTSTQLVISPFSLSIPGTYYVWARNPANAGWSGGLPIVVSPMY